MSDPVVSLSEVTFGFGDLTIVEELSISIEPGELVGLIGPNGSGKTTFLELLGGLRSPDAGTVSRQEADRDVAYLPQSPAFRPGFTARETLQFYADLAGTTVDPDEYLTRVGLATAAERHVEALSGGMTRLLGLAQMLVGDPPLVVLDEPTSGLDPEMADHIFEVMADLTAEDRALVVASHDPVAVERQADRVLVIADGNVQLDGTPAELIEQTNSETLRDVISAARTVGTDDDSSDQAEVPNA